MKACLHGRFPLLKDGIERVVRYGSLHCGQSTNTKFAVIKTDDRQNKSYQKCL